MRKTFGLFAVPTIFPFFFSSACKHVFMPHSIMVTEWPCVLLVFREIVYVQEEDIKASWDCQAGSQMGGALSSFP